MKQHNENDINYEINVTGKVCAIKSNAFPRFEGFIKIGAVKTRMRELKEFYDFIGVIDQPADKEEFKLKLESAMNYFYENYENIAAAA